MQPLEWCNRSHQVHLFLNSCFPFDKLFKVQYYSVQKFEKEGKPTTNILLAFIVLVVKSAIVVVISIIPRSLT